MGFVDQLVYFFAELIAGFLTNSLALLSTAGHMLSDVGARRSAICFRMAGGRYAKAPRLSSSEILAALFNGLALWLIVGIFLRRFNRFSIRRRLKVSE